MNENSTLAKLDAFNSAFEFLKGYLDTEESAELVFILSGMRIGPSGRCQDANMMYTWVEALAKLRSVSVEVSNITF